MKRLLLLLVLFLSMAIGYAEETPPLYDVKIERHVGIAMIGDKLYKDVDVTVKSNNPVPGWTESAVRINVKDAEGKTVYKKKFYNLYLYVFSSGQIQVGKLNFNVAVITKKTGEWYAIINEKEGVYGD